MRWRRRTALCMLLAAPLVLSGAGARRAAAQGAASDATAPRWRLERDPDGLYLTARVPLQLPASLGDALQRGVPLHFVWHAELWRPRWYWTDRLLAQATRTVRLVFQPLTGRWRMSVHDGVAGSEGPAALQRVLESLDEALALVRSVQRWRVAASADLNGDERLRVEFRIDAGRLPRPLQWLPGHDGGTLPGWRTELRVPALTASDAGEGRP